MTRLCYTCSSLNLQRSDFTAPPWLPLERRHRDVCTRTFGELRASIQICDLCSLIWHACEKSDFEALSSAPDEDILSLQWAQNTFDWEPDDETDGIEDKFGSALYPCFGRGEKAERQEYGIQLVDDAETNGFLRGRAIGEKIDVALLRKWIQQCKDEHGWRCKRSFLEPRDFDATGLAWLTVIDVEDLCLHDLSKRDLMTPWDAQYAALSYVWGGDNTVLTLQSNVDAFRVPRGLNIRLPRTIADAIEVTRVLGYRYLWVDSLCIVQDDYSTKQSLMDVMDAIYSSADVTLVASTGTGADSGLSGWSDRLARPQHIALIGDSFRVGVLPYYQRELLDADHSRRAWTYQETCLSPRCLIFLNGSVYFNCGLLVRSEQIHAEVPGVEPENSANTLGRAIQRQSTLQLWGQHVYLYTVRTLTYQLDGMNAFKGIVRAAPSALMVEQRNFGMPASCFDWAILFNGSGSLRRRKEFPSWSFIGWEGGIQMSLPTHSRYDQMWLLQGTWINWFVMAQTGVRGAFTAITSQVPTSPRAREIVDALDHGRFVRVTANDAGGSESELNADTVDRDDMPTYAPTLGDSLGQKVDPLGRRTHLEAMRLIPTRPDIVYEETSCSPLDGSLLWFAAPCVSVQTPLLMNQNGLELMTPLSLFDRLGRMCGSVSIASNAEHESWSTVKLLLVSVTPFGDLSQYHSSGVTGRIFREYGVDDDLGEYIEEGPEGLDRFDFLNVMYVKETDRQVELTTTKDASTVVVHERAGIGFIYREALRHVGEISWADFVLG